jgi:hypothetical protein
MEIAVDKRIEMRIAHLEQLQTVIGRMATYSAALKNYCISVVMALGGLALTVHQSKLFLIAAITTLAFACVDARYLELERGFRSSYNAVRGEPWEHITNFEITPLNSSPFYFWSALMSWSSLAFYGPILISILVLSVF